MIKWNDVRKGDKVVYRQPDGGVLDGKVTRTKTSKDEFDNSNYHCIIIQWQIPGQPIYDYNPHGYRTSAGAPAVIFEQRMIFFQNEKDGLAARLKI